MQGATHRGRGQLRDYMAQQYWVASRIELLALGFVSETIDSWLEAERLVPLLQGVYCYGRDVETIESTWKAALLAAGPGSVLAGRSACELWGLVRTDRAIPKRIQVASPKKKSIRFTGRSAALSQTRVQVVRRTFEEGECPRRQGLDVTSAPRALIDYAVEAQPVALKFAFLEACRLGHFHRRDVAYCFRRVSGRRGARKLSPLLALWVPELGRIKSVLEGLFLLAWVDWDRSRMPLVNHKLCGYEVDCYWPEQRLVVELDGGAFHGDPLARARDRAKDRALRLRGFQVLRFDYDPVYDNPGAVVQQVSEALDAQE